ncbi:acyltransferase [Amycolatopsis sp. WAC 01375]|uniref:acyltransferase n=1 Tax=Amycolatopsis sp. WAC 01375 TaxID=2203194 RepID=UPI00131569FD|nr:acyltransferase [Amycolatopsis sp. WAC 01375]
MLTSPGSGSDPTPEAEARRIAAELGEFQVPGDYPFAVAGSVTSPWGMARVIRVEPARVLHVIGASEMAEQLRALYGRGAIAGWSLLPLPESRTPLEQYQSAFEAIPQREGGARGHKQLTHAGFAHAEEVAACPDSVLLRIRNIGPSTLTRIRSIVGGPPAEHPGPRIEIPAPDADGTSSAPRLPTEPAALRTWWREQRTQAAIIRASPESDGFAEFGGDTMLAFPQGVLDGSHRIALGARCLINEHVTLSAGFPGDDTPGPVVIRLGDGVVLGRRCELHAMESIRLGADVFVGPGALFFDHNHVDVDPGVPIGHQLPLQAAPVEIGAGSWIGAGAIILAGARIGEHSRVGAGTVVVSGDYPPGSLIVGARPRVLPRTPLDLSQ